MTKYPQLTAGLSAIIAYAVITWAGHFYAYAQNADAPCSVDCLKQSVDSLNQKTEQLQRTIDQLTAQVGRAIKSGQTITLHTQAGERGGCLTYIGPSGDRGGYVSWNENCSRGTAWTIDWKAAK